ncbi:MAG TPA: hydroxyisourate hydrolase [Candidatus Acidoferrales bacterium]|jgi:5-hydroxyisourate hydrolase|nr:hydroxyisourate hydrolase [Candidatus Acidoferrales bacterium]
MSAITTHVLDTSRGRPAADVKVELHKKSGEDWKSIGVGHTDATGRCNSLLGETLLAAGTYRLMFHAGAYFQALRLESFYSDIPVIFDVHDATTHYHVPLLISPFGYSTYRGS